MRRVMASTKNFGEYRESLHAANPPCIPFFGMNDAAPLLQSTQIYLTSI